jgi:DNA polymerase
MAELAAAIQLCRRCPLGTRRTLAVPGEGPVPCDIMLVGEGPGAVEDATGRPFVGRAGQLLRRLLREEARLDPEAVYITNVVKCRSSIDRDGRRVDTPPPLDCVRACDPWLRRQIETVRPRAIIVAGAVACRHLLGAAIGEVHGTLIESPDRSTFYLPVYHPAAALRDPARMRDLVHAMKGIGLWLDAHQEVRRHNYQYDAPAHRTPAHLSNP